MRKAPAPPPRRECRGRCHDSSAAVVAARPPLQTKSASHQWCRGKAAGAERRWQDGGAAARGGCWRAGLLVGSAAGGGAGFLAAVAAGWVL